MSTLTWGIIIFVLVTMMITAFMVKAIFRDRENRRALRFGTLIPYVIADAVWVVIFFVWLLRTV